MRDIRRIFVHCTAGSQKQTKDDLLREFKAKGWSAPGYHYVVFPDGRVVSLLAEEKVSNGVQGYNSTSINVAYVGGIDNRGKAVDNRTPEQKRALRGLLESLQSRYPNARIMGHRDIWGKDKSKWKKMCPCFDAEAEYANLTVPVLDKYEDAAPAQPEIYVKEHKTDYLSKLKKYIPWMS